MGRVVGGVAERVVEAVVEGEGVKGVEEVEGVGEEVKGRVEALGGWVGADIVVDNRGSGVLCSSR